MGSLKAVSSSIQFSEGSALIRVCLSGRPEGRRRIRRTVTAGMDPFCQLVGAYGVPSSVVSELRSLWADAADRLAEVVSEAKDGVLSNAPMIEAARERAARLRTQREETDRAALVSSMSALLRSGWTRGMLISAVDEATIGEVMRT